jgi:hypothetical protein
VALNTIKQQTNKYYSDNYCASISINYHANTLIVAVLEIKIRADGQYICNNKKITIIKRFIEKEIYIYLLHYSVLLQYEKQPKASIFNLKKRNATFHRDYTGNNGMLTSLF